MWMNQSVYDYFIFTFTFTFMSYAREHFLTATSQCLARVQGSA
jgi:hypothetical protein